MTLEFLYSYAGFLAKTITFVIAFIVVAAIITGSFIKGGNKKTGTLKVTSLNDFYKHLHDAITHSRFESADFKALKKAEKLAKKQKVSEPEKTRVFVLDFVGDTQASSLENLRHEVTALLGNATNKDEVVVRLESPGGAVHAYGLASSQLARIRDAGIPLTICVDKIAASGGYMMASIGTKIISAPFAVLGSIGVVAQIPNINRLLKKHEIDVELMTAGAHKRTLTTMGENTVAGREKFQQEINTVHELFKTHVTQYRPSVNIEDVSTGEAWFGLEAIDKNLSDEIGTSDEYLAKCAKSRDLLLLTYKAPKTKGLMNRMGLTATTVLETALVNAWGRLMNHRGY
jgi:serine protease SohB